MNNPTLVHSIPEACSIACAGRTALYEAIRTGALRAVKRGRRTLILDEDLRRWVQNLPQVSMKQSVLTHDHEAVSGTAFLKCSTTDGKAADNCAGEMSRARKLGRVL